MTIQTLTGKDLLRIALKRKWWIIGSLILCIILASIAWAYFPKRFKSTVIVTIDSPRVAKDYVKGLAEEERPYEDPMNLIMQRVTMGLTDRSILTSVLATLSPFSTEETASEDSSLQLLRQAIKVSRPKDGVGVAIGFVHRDPGTAQSVAALLVQRLQEELLKQRGSLVENTTKFISVELKRLRADLEDKEREIASYKKLHIGELPEHLETNLRQLDRLEQDKNNSRDSMNKTLQRLATLEKSIKEFSGREALSGLRTQGRMLNDPRAARLHDLRQKLNELMATYKESYPDIVHLKEEIRRIESEPQNQMQRLAGGPSADGEGESEIGRFQEPDNPYLRELLKERDEVQAEVEALKKRYESAVQQIEQVEGRIQRTPHREERLAVLQRDYDNMQKSYQSLLEKKTNVKMVEHYESRNFGESYRIIEPANYPKWPEPPNQIHFALGAILIGCLLGLGLSIGAELMQAGFHKAEDAELYLGIPVIASIPKFDAGTKQVVASNSQRLLTGPVGSATDTHITQPSYLSLPRRDRTMLWRRGYVDPLGRYNPHPNLNLIAKWAPTSLAAEQYRVAATRLILMMGDKKHPVTLVTSSVMEEGKTTSAVNLAYVLSRDLNKSTLVIDCDLKRPKLHEYFNVSSGPGLTELIDNSAPLEKCVHRYEALPLWIMPTGDNRGDQTIGLSGVQFLKRLLPQLKEAYDHIILDAPPIMPLADVNVLSEMADMTAFVIRAGRTNEEIAKVALKALGGAGDVGIILTQVEMEHTPYYMYASTYVSQANKLLEHKSF